MRTHEDQLLFDISCNVNVPVATKKVYTSIHVVLGIVFNVSYVSTIANLAE